MKRLPFFTILVLFLPSLISEAQALRDINFKHLYDPEAPAVLIRTVRENTQWSCYYSIESRDTAQIEGNFSLDWEIRKSLNDKEGTPVSAENAQTLEASGHKISGKITLPVSAEPEYLVARLRRATSQQSYSFYATLQPNYPETTSVTSNGEPLVDRFVKINTPITLNSNDEFFVAHYDDNFPTAPLAFSEALGKVSKQMRIDSTFKVNGNAPFMLPSRGLYLMQKDTSAAEGVAFRAEGDYPRYSRLKNLAAPLIYICTNQEFEKIRAADGEKKAFDRVILSITKDQDRAKKLIRNYFKRVEWANEFFTSYKEGWKTDRGMIYIIFGAPDEVHRSADREVWNYKQQEYKAEFAFVRSPSLFDPHNLVLVRNRKYKDLWYEVIDLWRNARF
jgi:GWxTD domain-containing protein